MAAAARPLVRQREEDDDEDGGEEEYTPAKTSSKKITKAARVEEGAANMTPAKRRKELDALGKMLLRKIRSTGHHDPKKPKIEIKKGMPRAEALALLGNVGTIKSNTARMQRRVLEPAELVSWLGVPEQVDDVKFDGKIWYMTGAPPPRIRVTATYESVEVCVEAFMLTIKVRTVTLR